MKFKHRTWGVFFVVVRAFAVEGSPAWQTHPISDPSCAAQAAAEAPRARRKNIPGLLARNFDLFAAHYEKELAEENWQAPQWIARAFANYARKKSDLKILDLGVGTGLVGQLIYDFNSQVHLWGIDLSSRMRKLAAQRNIYEVVRPHDINKPLKWVENNSFDAFTAAGVFDFADSLPDVLQECSRVLRSGGAGFFSVPLFEAHNPLAQAVNYNPDASISYAYTLPEIRVMVSRIKGLKLAGLDTGPGFDAALPMEKDGQIVLSDNFVHLPYIYVKVLKSP